MCRVGGGRGGGAHVSVSCSSALPCAVHQCVCVMPDQMMSFAGTEELCALMHIGSVGKLGVEENKKFRQGTFILVSTRMCVEK